MNYQLIIRILGRILLLESAALLPSLAVSLIYRDGAARSIVITMLILLIIGVVPKLILKGETKVMQPREGFIAVALCWILISVFGALPFFLSGMIPNYIDALFETISGFTTTGASILTSVEGLPESLVFWRSFTHWLGGMGVLVLTIAIMPAGERGVFNLVRAEATGPVSSRLVPRLRRMASLLYVIYAALSFLMLIFLLCGGMNLYDSLVHMFSTAGTGGFSNRNLNIAYYDSVYIEYVLGAFMIMFSINLGLFYAVLTRKFTQVVKNSELKVFFSIVAVSIAAITLNLITRGGYDSVSTALRHAFFHVSATISTTGYAAADYIQWPEFSKMILLILLVFGGCAGSTSGGLKVVRIVMLCKSAAREVKKILHPRSVSVVHINGQAVQEKALTGVLHYLIIYTILAVLASLLISVENKGLETAFSEVLTMLSNAGPGFGFVGPTANYSFFSPFSKLVLSICMLFGRLEIYPILMLILPSAWRKA